MLLCSWKCDYGVAGAPVAPRTGIWVRFAQKARWGCSPTPSYKMEFLKIAWVLVYGLAFQASRLSEKKLASDCVNSEILMQHV